MNFNKITKYDNCDLLSPDINKYGFDKTLTLGQMIDMALIHNCPIIVKGGYNGKWYLKGLDKDIDYLKSKINENIGKYIDGRTCYLIE